MNMDPVTQRKERRGLGQREKARFKKEGAILQQKSRARNTDEYKQSKQIKRLMKKAQMTDEEREEERQRNYFRQMAKEASMDPEELEEYNRHRRKIATDWRRNLDEEGRKRYMQSIYASQKKQYEKLKQDPEKWQKLRERSCNYQRRRWQNMSEEDKLYRKTQFRINQKRKKVRIQLQSERVPEEIIEQRVKEMEDAIWREVFPQGKPPPKKKGPTVRKPRTAELYEVDIVGNKFWCMKCKPFKRIDGTNRIVGFKTKSELLVHVKANHRKWYHLCEHCNLLKYSKLTLRIHQQMCREIVGPQRGKL